VQGTGDTDPAAASFGSGFTRVDAARDPDALLDFLDDAANTDVMREVKRRATRSLALTPGDRILDIGCGTGVDLEDMLAPAQPGGRVTGIDVSVAAVERAHARFGSNPHVQVEVADVHDLPFRDASFEAARADRVLLHLERPDAALAEMRRVLAPGGRLVILELVLALIGPADLLEDPVHAAIEHRFWAPGEHRDDINFFLPLLLRQAGFAHVEADRGQVETSEFAAVDAILRLRTGIEGAVADGRCSEQAAGAWLATVQAALAAGTASARVSYLAHLAHAAG
jgi:SAM-dependent methyltransferase